MPPQAPTRALEIIAKNKRELGDVNVRMVSGAIFCQERSSAEFNQDSLFIVGGNQKWSGAAPSFNNMAVESIVFVVWLTGITINRIIIIEPIACIKKYFIADSVELGELIRRGKNLSRFISRPIQAVNQDEAETVMRVPTIRVIKNRI